MTMDSCVFFVLNFIFIFMFSNENAVRENFYKWLKKRFQFKFKLKFSSVSNNGFIF